MGIWAEAVGVLNCTHCTPKATVSMSDQEIEDLYPCVGICMADPASGLCQGCGRPLAEPETSGQPVDVLDLEEKIIEKASGRS
jgi:hypothetical protein